MAPDDETAHFEQMLRRANDYDLFQLTALAVGLDPDSPVDREWVLAVVSDDWESPDDLLPAHSKASDRAVAWRTYYVLEALLLAGRLSEARLAGWRVKTEQGRINKQLLGEYLGDKGEELLMRDSRLMDAYDQYIQINGRRGAVEQLAERFGMSSRNVRLRLAKIQSYQPELDQRERQDRMRDELRKFEKGS